MKSQSVSPRSDALKQLWRLAYPNRELPSLKSELWKDMGWQGSDPSTDLRYVKQLPESGSLCLLIFQTFTHFSFKCYLKGWRIYIIG
ncbi:hypothetical protein SLEP1_g19396 [Rubroshorea leprosula]|nr:hypothetical protein SLEP1_g19396 [Rubroshorea leprosula]